MSNLLSKDEQECLDVLADAWNKFLELQEVHKSDKEEFMYAIHLAQNIILARPVIREKIKEFYYD